MAPMKMKHWAGAIVFVVLFVLIARNLVLLFSPGDPNPSAPHVSARTHLVQAAVQASVQPAAREVANADFTLTHGADQRDVNKLDGSATAQTFAELEKFYQEINQEDTAVAARQEACALELPEHESRDCIKAVTRLAVVVPFIPNQIDKVESYLHTGMVTNQPCSAQNQGLLRADLIFSVRNQQDVEQIQARLRLLTDAVELDCFKSVFLTHPKLNERESNDYNIGPPAYFHNTLNSSWLIGDAKAGFDGYSHMFWMEPDTLPVKTGWLEALTRETQQMQAQGVWMRGSIQQHNMKMYGDLDRYHLNGNAIYAVGSKPFRTFLRHARRYVPTDVTAFDYAIQVWRAQYGKQDQGHAYITQVVQHKFQETATLSNHPSDLCPGVADWSHRNPLARIVHGNQVLQLLQGSKCCETSSFEESMLQRAQTELAPAYECLKNEMKAAWAVHTDDGNYERKTENWKDEKPASETELPINAPLLPLL